MSRQSKLYLGKDDNGSVTYETPWPGENQSYQVQLAIGVEQTLAVPSWASSVKIVVPGVVSCGYGDTPLTLAIGNWQSELSEINPILRKLTDPNGNRISTLRFISYQDNIPINVVFYDKNESERT